MRGGTFEALCAVIVVSSALAVLSRSLLLHPATVEQASMHTARAAPAFTDAAALREDGLNTSNHITGNCSFSGN